MNPATELAPQLKQLRLSGILDSLDARNRQAIDAKLAYTEFLALLIQDEIARREQKKFGTRLRRAAFRATKTLEGYEFDRLPSTNRALVHELATGRYIDERAPVLIVGPCGTGKSHLAQALGHCAVRQGHDVIFASCAQLLASLNAARAVGTNQWDNSGIASRSVFAPNATFGRYSLSDLYQRQYSQEFQAVGSFGDELTYVAGVYYFKEHVKESAATPLTNQWNADGTNYVIRNPSGTSRNAAGTAGWEYASRFLTRASRADTTSTAIYGQATYNPASMAQFHLTAGGRVTKDKRDGVLYVVNGRATNFVFEYDDSRFDPLVTLAYDASENVNLYAKYSTGFRAGGANSRSQTFTAFKPEEVKAFEVGSKMYLLDHRMRLNVAAYAMDRTDTQIDFDNVDTTIGSPTIGAHTEETRNAPGKSKIRGLEAELTYKPIDNMTLGFNYAYTSVKVPAAPFPFTGNADVPVGTPFP